MFKLNHTDEEMFVILDKANAGIKNHHITAAEEEFSDINRGSNLEPYLNAYSFTQKAIRGKVDRNNEEHRKLLGLGLAVQRDSSHWAQFNKAEQQTLLNLLAIKYTTEEQQRNQFLSRVMDKIFSIQTLNDINTVVGASGVSDPRVLLFSAATFILLGRLEPASSPDDGMSINMVKNLNKLDIGDILESGIKLSPEASQFATRKIKSEIGELRQILRAYGLKLNDLTKEQQKQFHQLYSQYKQKEEVKKAQETYFQRMNDAKEFFKGIQGLASLVENPKTRRNLQLVGLIGEQGINIAGKVMELGGLIPGIAAPTGIGMLLPMANIAICVGSILLALKKKKPEKSFLEEALKTISMQIEELRKEMHERFDLIEEQLKEIYNCLIDGFEQIRNIITFEQRNLREMIGIVVGRLQADIDELTAITESGHKQLALINYKDTIFTPIEGYIDGIDKTPIESIKIVTLEQNWLNGQFCSGMFAGKYYRSDQPYHQIAKIAYKNEALILGYLARLAVDRLGIRGINNEPIDVDLPSLDLWLEGLGLALLARTYLKWKDNKAIPLVYLENIKEKALHSLEFIAALSNSVKSLYENIFDIYLKGLTEIENKIVKLLVEKIRIDIPSDTVSVSEIDLTTIRSVNGQIDQYLDAKHFKEILKTKANVPTVLILANRLGLGDWEASYEAVKVAGGAGQGSGGNWSYATHRRPATAIYTVKLYFKFNTNEILPIAQVKFHGSITEWSGKVEGRNAVQQDVANIQNYLAEQAQITLETLVKRDWNGSYILPKGITFDDNSLKKVTELYPTSESVIKEAWRNLKTFNLSKEQRVFFEMVVSLNNEGSKDLFNNMIEQLKAAHVLAVTYGKLIGFSEEQMNELNNILTHDLDSLFFLPNLFFQIPNRTKVFLENLMLKPEFSESSVVLKLRNAIDIISVFELHSKVSETLDPDKFAEANLNARFIDWSQIEIEKNKEGKDVCLGSGGFGSVFKAKWSTEKGTKMVAVKIIEGEVDEENIAFRSEIEKLSTLFSPYIIHSYGYSKKERRLCLILELAKESLDKLLEDKQRKIAEEQALKMVMQIARGLRYLHRNNIIHGDIKSLNILLDENGNAKINDFGLASTAKQAKRKTITHSSRRGFSKTKVRGVDSLAQSRREFCASPLWQPPEAVTLDIDRRKPQSMEGDVYSFGVVIWEIFSRSLPFEMLDSESDIRSAILEQLERNGKKLKRQDIDKIPDNVPKEVAEIIIACWEKDPSKRPTAASIVERLEKSFSIIAMKLDEVLKSDSKDKQPQGSKLGADSQSAGVPPSDFGFLIKYRELMKKLKFPKGNDGSFKKYSNGTDKKGDKELLILQGQLPETNMPIFFNEFESGRDGSCGFYSLGISREICVKQLLELSNDPNARHYLSEELIQEITGVTGDIRKDGVIEGGKISTKTFDGDVFIKAQELAHSYLRISKEAPILVEKINKEIRNIIPNAQEMGLENPALIAQLRQLNLVKILAEFENFQSRQALIIKNIMEFCEDEQTFRNYVQQLRPRESRAEEAWLGIRAAILLAQKMNFDLYIWYKTAEPQKLICNHYHKKVGNVKIYHLVHTNHATHFNLLAEPSRAEQRAQDSAFASSSEQEGNIGDRNSEPTKQRSEAERPDKVGLGL